MTKEEKSAYDKKYYIANKEKRTAQIKSRYDTKRSEILSHQRDYYHNNKESSNERSRLWRLLNPGGNNAKSARYRAAKLQRTPVWADHLVISMIYEDCPAGHQVDHIYPLQGDTVSGLHVPWNLQYLTESENQSKGNRYEP